MVLFKSGIAGQAHVQDIFTFHYGPIQMPDNLLCMSHFLSFTFHYGPIQITSDIENDEPPLLFTFHYGPIQI